MSDTVAPDIAAALDSPVDAPVMAQPGDTGPQRGGDRAERPPLDPSCPVRPLGIMSDVSGTQKCYYLDINGQLVGLEAGNRHGKNSMIALFGMQSDWLEVHFPQWSKPVTEYDRSTKTHTIIKPSEIVGFDQAEASRALIEDCVRKGIFDPAGKMRGRGAHSLTGGGLVVHCGDQVLAVRARVTGDIDDRWHWQAPGIYDGHVYTAAAPIPRPHHEPVNTKAAEKLLALFMTWRWKRALLDPRFLLGWIACAMVGGALDWRPNIWITGGRGTGKSTLNGEGKVLHQLFGGGLMTTAEASAAAIRQTLKNSTVPVLFDEIEASEDNRRVNEIVALARVASSGATVHRGGQDHQAHEFKLRSCFQFSSINIPALQPQDRSRLGILELMPFAPGDLPPVLEDYRLPTLGRHLQRRMVDGWPRFEETLRRFKRALAMVGHDNRACDQFGALLAGADLLLNDEVPDDEEVAHWAGLCRPERMAEVSEATPDEQQCLIHILTSMVQARGGDEREALGSWIGRAVAAAVTPLMGDAAANEKTTDRLQQIGLKLVNAKYHQEERDVRGEIVKSSRWGAESYMPGVPGYLAVAGSHQALAALFAGTRWQSGVWRQALARTAAGGGAVDGVKVKFGKMSLTSVLVPLCAVIDDSELPAASKADAAAEWMAAQVKGMTA